MTGNIHTNPPRRDWLTWIAGLCLAWLCLGAAHADNSLQTVNISQGSNDSQVIKISLRDDIAAEPIHFTTANPHRIVLDFPKTVSEQGRIAESVGKGVVKTYNVIQAGDRTRVVLNLSGPASYEVRPVGNHVLVVVRGEKMAADAGAPATFAETGSKRAFSIRDVEFKRGKTGEGRIVVTLSDPGVGLDIRQKGADLLVEFANTALPASLQRRLDVNDFGTPAQTIETVGQGKATRMKVVSQGKWDYSAYQTGEQFTVELRALDDPRQQAAADRPRYSGEKLTLNFQNVGVREVLQVIGDFTGLNIIASDTVTGNVTLRLKDVPWDQALDIILRAKGLDKRTTGNVIWIAPRDELAAKEKLELEAKQQISDLEEMQIEVIRLNYLRANEAQSIVNGQSVAALQAGEKVSCAAQAAGVGGTATTTTAQTAAAATGQRVLSKRGTVTYDLKTNTLFVQDTPSKIKDIKDLLATVDIPTRQVMIEARIVVADDKFNQQLGIRLGYQFGGGVGGVNVGVSGTGAGSATNAAGGAVGAGPSYNVDLPTTLAAPSLGFTLLGASLGSMLNLELQALEADKRGKIVSNPRVITQNQKPAVILQGQQIPYITPATPNSPPTVSFKDAFLCLLVDPQILNNDNIILNVEVQKDAAGSAIAGQIPIETKRVKTQVQVKNGETAVLGGIFEQEIRTDVNKVPLLGDLPILGHLFRDKQQKDEKTELLIFLTPRVLTDTIQ